MKYGTLIGPRIKRLNNAFFLAADRSAKQSGLTGTQAFILGHLAHQTEPVCARDLEQQFKLRHPTISGVLQRLEAKEMIAFVPDTGDRRCKRICVTPIGMQSSRRAAEALHTLEDALTTNFTPEEKLQFCALLDKAIAGLGQQDCPCPLCEREEEPI